MLVAVADAALNAAVAASTVHVATDGDDVEDNGIEVEDVEGSTADFFSAPESLLLASEEQLAIATKASSAMAARATRRRRDAGVWTVM